MTDRDGELNPPSSGVGMDQEAETNDEGHASPILRTEQDRWRNLLETQHRNMMELMKVVLEPKKKAPKLIFPDFNPEDQEANAQAWCNTVDICLKENPASGSQLIMLLSRALKGSAATWLSHNSHHEVTWAELKSLFLSRFDSIETSAATLFKVLSSSPNEGENMSTYVSRILNTLTTRWQNMTVEQVAISVALAHVARNDNQVQRMAFTTEIKSRIQLQRELMPFVYRKRSLPPSDKIIQASDAKKPRMEPPRRCYNCGKIGHLAIECRGSTSKNQNTNANMNRSQSTSTSNYQQRKEPRTVVCFRCGEAGHIAPHCTKGQKKTEDHDDTSAADRRVNVCAIKPATDYLYNNVLFLLSATFVLSLIAPVFLLSQSYRNTNNNAPLSDMVLKNNSLAYSVWQKPKVQPLMKVHLFNYTNWRRYKDGYEAKLHVEDVGPYVYSFLWGYEDDIFNAIKPIWSLRGAGRKYDQFGLLAENNNTLTDKVTINTGEIDIDKLNVIEKIDGKRHLDLWSSSDCNIFLWGYEDDIFNAIKPIWSLRGAGRKYDQFGLLAENNNTLTDKVTINTGEIDIDKLNVIEKIDGKRHLDLWSSSDCNSIEATDGSLFPPSQLDRRKPLLVFYKNLCRSLPFVYEKDIEIDGIPLIRYRLSEDVFDDPHHNAENQCYCDINSGTCPPQGIVNVTACALGTPALVSFPHFYGGDPKLRESITGLKPDLKMHHDNYLDIHPTLGIVVTGKASLQMNMQVIKTDGLSSLSFLDQDMILPIAWIETVVEEVPESLHALIHGKASTSAVQVGLAAISMTTILISELHNM